MQHSLEQPVATARFTEQAKAASKLAPGLFGSVLARLPRHDDSNLVVGFDRSDVIAAIPGGPLVNQVQI